MPIYNEIWPENDILPRSHVHLRDLPKNHLLKLKALNFQFIEYKTHQQLSCHIYERMMIHCFNQYGVIEAQKKLECLDATSYFHDCLQINAYFAGLRDRTPQYFLNNPFSRYKPHFDELAI